MINNNAPKKLVGINISKIENNITKKGISTMLSNINFKALSNETTSFIFSDPVEQNAFIRILRGFDSSYSGYIEWNNKVFHSSNNSSLKEIITFQDLFFFDKEQQPNNIFNYLRNTNLNPYYDSFIEKLLQKQPQIIESNLNDIHLEIKKQELTKMKNILEIMKKNNDYLFYLNNELDQKQNPYDKKIRIFYDFIQEYKKYLESRIRIMIDTNIDLVHIFLNQFDEKGDLKQSQEIIKLNELKQTIELSVDLINNKKQKQITQTKENNQIDEILEEISSKNKTIFQIKYKEYINKALEYKKKYLLASSDHSKKTNYFFYYVNYLCARFFKKNSKKMMFLGDDEIQKLSSELNFQYNSIVLNVNQKLFDFEAKLTSFKTSIKRIVQKDFSIHPFTFWTLSKQNKKQIIAAYNDELKQKKDDEDKTNLTSQTSNLYITQKEINFKKMELQNLRDDLKWERTQALNIIHDEIRVINNNIDVQLEQYTKTKKEIKNNISTILSEMKTFENESPTENMSYKTKEILTKINYEKFLLDIEYHENIYKKIRQDSKIISQFLINAIHSGNAFSIKKMLFKYIFIKKSLENEVSILEFWKPINQVSLLTKSKLLLIQSVMENKQILVFNNLFKNLNKLDKLHLQKTYNKIKEETNKSLIWIQITDDFNSIIDISNQINLIYSSKNIEFGTKDEILKNPIYDLTFNDEEMLLKHKLGLVEKENFWNDEYDCYKINDNHYVYSSITNFYKWTKQIPLQSKLTQNQFKIEELKNEIAITKQSKTRQSQTQEQQMQEESILIDVTKEFTNNKKLNKKKL